MDPPPGPGEWPRDVDRLERDVMPVVEELHVYLLHPGPCRVLEYDRGDYRDGDPEDCGDLVPFDAQARADFDRMTDAIERSGVAVERIRRDRGAIYIPLEDYSRQYKLGVRVPARCRHTARHDVARGAMDAHPR
jgi:hypothetical protein